MTSNVLFSDPIETDAHALRELLKLAGPTVAQMVSYTVMQFIDTWMLAHKLGPMAPTAASNAGSLSFAFIGFGMGTLFIVNTLASQAFGKKDFAKCGQYLWQGVWFALLFSLALLPLIPILNRAFAAFGHSAEELVMERVYVRYMIAAAGLKLVQTAFSQFMLATNRPGVVFLSSVMGVIVNALAAWIMVFGEFGVRPMGVTGAALGMVLGMAVELIVLIVYACIDSKRHVFNTFDWRFRAAEFRTLVQLGFGSGLQMIAEIAAWAMFMNWVMGQLGENAMAAMAFMLRYLVVSFLPAVGISSAVTALVGRYIGMGKPELAIRRAHLGYRVALCYLVVCGSVYLFARHQLMQLFTHDPEVVRLGSILLIFAAFYQLFDGMYVIYCGALRGAGDTFIPAITCAGLCWTLMVGGGYVVAHNFPRLSVAGPWSVAFVYGMTLGLFMFIRFHRGGWRKIHLAVDRGASTMAIDPSNVLVDPNNPEAPQIEASRAL